MSSPPASKRCSPRRTALASVARYEDRFAQRPGGRRGRTLERGGVLLAEAPTGVGKSLAYLLPAVLAALETSKVVVAT